jgi:amino acid transporter
MTQLKKELNQTSVWSLAVGAIIGWGAFVLPGNKFLPDAGPLGTMIAMSIAAVMMMIIAKNYGVMTHRYPIAGGEFTYAYIGFARFHAFFAAWFLGLSYLSIVPLNATALGLISRAMFPGIFQQGLLYTIAGWNVYLGEVILASVAILLITYLNHRGVKLFGQFATLLATFLVFGVVILMGWAIISPIASFENLQPAFSLSKAPLEGILAIIAIAPWAFVGFDTIAQASEEMNFDVRKSAKLMIFSIIVGALIYIMLTIITAMVGPWPTFIQENSNWATGSAVRLIAGDVGLWILGAAIMSAILSGLNGFMHASSRLFFAMAKTSALPSPFKSLHPITRTPTVSLLFIAGVSLLAPWFGRAALLWIVDMASVGAAIGFFYTSASTLVLAHRNKEDIELRKNRLFGWLGSLFSLMFIVLLVWPASPVRLETPSMIALVVWSILGLVFITRAKSYRTVDDSILAKQFTGEE